MLASATHWFIDSTFYTVPTEFYQLMNILIFNPNTNLYIPVAYALTSHKSFKLYLNLFLDIAKLLGNTDQDIKVTIDFEKGLRQALKVVFPKIQIIGCQFHFSQCLRRKAQKLGLLKENSLKETEKYRLAHENKIREYKQNVL